MAPAKPRGSRPQVSPRPWGASIAGLARGRAPHALALVLVLGGALALRLFGLNWDQGQHLHPDERFLSMVLTQIRPATDAAQYFDPVASPLNPFNQGISFFVYGTFPLFLVEWLARLTGFEGYDRAYLLGRALSALFDTGTVLLVYLLGRRLVGPAAGLIAAALLALAVHSIQLAHFFAVDTFATFFVTAGLLFFVRYADERRPRDLGLFGVAAGLAMASKLSAGLLPALFGLWWLWRGWRDGQMRSGWRPLVRWGTHALAFALLAAVTFRLFQPYAFAAGSPLDWRISDAFLNAVGQQKAIQEGSYDWPPGVQWAGTTPYLFPLEQIVRWGLGPASGALALGGVAAAAVTLWRRGRHPLGLMLLWAGLNFAYFGALVLKTMRYLHPIYPVLALVAAWLLVAAWRRRRRLTGLPPRLVSRALVALGLLALAATAVWTFAFMQIYARDHTRVTASEWIYANLPPGSVIATEHWDDSLPLDLPGRSRAQYEFVDLRVFDREDARKRADLLAALTEADAIVVASNRGSGSIPRMPQRYPLAGRYYQALFAGELGFERAAEFRSSPNLGPWTIDDAGAEEAFTVYDHPTVTIFRRSTPNVSASLRAAFASVDERSAVPVLPRVATAKTLDLTPEQAEAVRSSFDWPAVFEQRPLRGAAAVLAWYAAILIAGLAVWPLVWRAVGTLPDAGYAAARVLGPALVALPAWWLASLNLLPFDAPALLLSLGLLAGVGGLLLWRGRRRIFSDWRRAWRSIAVTEGLLLAAFAGMVALRAQNPDLWHPVFGGEKPMDYAQLNAVIRSTSFPPYDPWFAGSRLNYYYFGHVPTAGLAKLLGVVPAVAYNLALSSYFAGAVAAVFAVGAGVWAMLRRPGLAAFGVGLLAVSLVLLAGNLHSATQVVRIAGLHAADPTSTLSVLAQIPTTILGGDLARDYDFWAPTRVIPSTVNEFPWFTFTYGDLHPHLMNFGFTALALLLALALLGLGERARRRGALGVRAWVAALALQALVLGLHRVTNPWDFPTYLAITLVVLAYALWRSERLRGRAVLAWTLAAGAALVVATQALFLPFHQNYVDFFGGVVPTPETTAAQQWLIVFGAPVAVLLTLVWMLLKPRRSLRHLGIVVAAGMVALLAGSVAGGETWSARLLLPALGVLLAMAAWRVRDRPLLLLPLAFFAGGLLLTAIPEVVAVRDDIGRLNTVFKTYLQTWTLLGLGAAIALPIVVPRLWRRSGGALRVARLAWLAVLAALALTVFVYPLAGTPHKLNLRIQATEPTLDGEAFLSGGTILDNGQPVPLSSDLRAFQWLRRNIAGAPTLLEAPTTIYRWGARVSVYTGLPTLIGWDWHVKQQHWGYVHAVEARLEDVRELFATPDPLRARRLLDRYAVDLIYIGELERTLYTDAELGKFEQMAALGVAPIYRDGPVVIYRVLSSPQPPGAPLG